MRTPDFALPILAALAIACGHRDDAAARSPESDSTAPASRVQALADSLLLTAPGGATIWWTGARNAADSTGASCTERGLVIVRGGARILVPLLMTRAAPQLVNDSTIRARLSLDCTDVDAYDVNLRTGKPTRVP